MINIFIQIQKKLSFFIKKKPRRKILKVAICLAKLEKALMLIVDILLISVDFDSKSQSIVDLSQLRK